ncbi:hypothetical protein [Chryseobacterium indoltheticum]|uniref:hypothetical protein n=1 Tax=Chryseobacterium indoltheticum TaxID=254 RepID=UPI003F49A0A5
MKTDLGLVDQTVSQLNSFLKSKDIKSEKLMVLDNDSISTQFIWQNNQTDTAK